MNHRKVFPTHFKHSPFSAGDPAEPLELAPDAPSIGFRRSIWIPGPDVSEQSGRVHRTDPNSRKRLVEEARLRAEQARMEQDLQESRRLREEQAERLAWTAHELKNPLTVIKLISSLLVEEGFSKEERNHYLQIISGQVDRLLRMIEETLDMATLDAGKPIRLHRRTLDVAERLAPIVEFYQFSTSCHTLNFELDGGSHLVFGDGDKLDQVFYNLIGNAVKYSPEGGAVTTRSLTTPEYMQVSVSDQGLGMTTEQLAGLFQRHTRVHTQSHPGIKGTGLGLYLSRYLVEAHGGRIWAESQPGAGSQFYVRLPIQSSPLHS